jgi:hypothetical protein
MAFGGFAGQIRNTRCFENIADLMGSKFRNPSMSPERARTFLRAAIEYPNAPHWV